jgi:hypothetical protein
VCRAKRWPFAFLQVYADAEIERERDLVVDVMMAVAERMSGQRPGDEARMPHSPRRHSTWTVTTTHWVSAAVPWGAPDPGLARLGADQDRLRETRFEKPSPCVTSS